MKKHIIYALSASFLFTGCVMESSYDQRATDENKEMIRDVFKAFNKHDFKQTVSYYADTAKFLDPSLGKEFVPQTPQQTEAKYSAMVALYPNLKDSTTNIIASQDKVVAQFITTGTSADGKQLAVPACTIFEVSNGKIISGATYYDTK